MTPNSFAIAVLFAWPVAMGLLTSILPVRRIVMISIIGGNLFLPSTGISIVGLPDYTRSFAAGLGALLPTLLLATPLLFSWRPKLIDVFFFAFLFAPGISSILNGLGPWDATSGILSRFLEWGIAYWAGRTIFNDEKAIGELAVGIVISGIVYAPLCIWEARMSPQLSMQIYGFRPSAFLMTKRWGGYRPIVFMQHGLAVAVWMASTSIVAWVLWRSKSITKISLIPMGWIALGLIILTIGLRSTGAAILLLGLICVVEFVNISRIKLALLALILMPTGYITLRVIGWEGQQLIQAISLLDDNRSMSSLNTRLENDTLIVDRAMQRPVFGWGGWGRWRVRDDSGMDITVSDSWWAILLGTTGVFGLIAAYGTFIASLFVLIRVRTRRRIFDGAQGAAWAIGFALLLFVLDTLANAMPNTAFMLAAGALSSYVVSAKRSVPNQIPIESHRIGCPDSKLTEDEVSIKNRTLDLR
jgi:hypothetical protein